ncbi:hypothetical protein CsSME_00033347 [Camellia sinensis var. sinensis]
MESNFSILDHTLQLCLVHRFEEGFEKKKRKDR